MKVYRVWDKTADLWLDWSANSFSTLAVYATSFSSMVDAKDAAVSVLESDWYIQRYQGHEILAMAIDVPTFSEDIGLECESCGYEVCRCHEEFDPYEAAGESRFGLPGGGSL